MQTAIASYTPNMFLGRNQNEFALTMLTDKDGKTAPLGDIRRFAVDSRGDGAAIAERLGIKITNWS